MKKNLLLSKWADGRRSHNRNPALHRICTDYNKRTEQYRSTCIRADGVLQDEMDARDHSCRRALRMRDAVEVGYRRIRSRAEPLHTVLLRIPWTDLRGNGSGLLHPPQEETGHQRYVR